MAYGNDVGESHMQSVLSRGLRKLYEIGAAETEEQKFRLLYQQNPSSTSSFLHDGLQFVDGLNGSHAYLEDMTEEEESFYVRQPFSEDEDSGPRDAWEWAHASQTSVCWTYQDEHSDLRKWGFVMWDQSRLDAIGVMEEEWDYTYGREERDLEEAELDRQETEREESFKIRSALYERGARGWWGGENKMPWVEQTNPRPLPGPALFPPNITPESLEDARELLASMKLPYPWGREHSLLNGDRD